MADRVWRVTVNEVTPPGDRGRGRRIVQYRDGRALSVVLKAIADKLADFPTLQVGRVEVTYATRRTTTP